ncbi:MFS transporter [Streptomyces europaeiscabiei]|uniref:MFS transporter n=1 Tax=Streptomyces europaeiscabiei TaxID=146819 RepID=UPI0029B33871|nr:MFS transporter [Streptomyces europaeiscabiei]MDX3586571.1 MFS transporter [Streptomyces europaeiscabiei]
MARTNESAPEAHGGKQREANRLLIAGSLLNSIAFFSASPFLTLYLKDHSQLSLAVIGAVVGSIALISAIGGIAGGVMVDRLGAVLCIRLGLAVYIATYLLLAMVQGTAAIVALIMLLGVGRLLVEPAMKKLMSLAGGDDGSIFRFRYMTLCIGAIVGPAIGGLLYLGGSVYLFVCPAALFAGYLLLLVVRGTTLVALDPGRGGGGTEEGRQSYAELFRGLVRDRRLMAAIGAGGMIFLVFSQIDSIIPLFIKEQNAGKAVALIASLLMVNAVLGIVLQVPIAWLGKKVSERLLIVLGCGAFAAGLLLFSAMQVSFVFLYVGIVFWTLGEAILLPMPDIAIHKMAEDGQKGTYFGLAELRYVGFFVGPVIGGGLLAVGATIYFVVMAVAIFGCVPLLAKSANRSESAVEALP